MKNKTTAQDPVVGRTAFVVSPGQRAGQSTVEAITDNGILIYALLPQNALACWNINKPFTIENQNIVDKVTQMLKLFLCPPLN